MFTGDMAISEGYSQVTMPDDKEVFFQDLSALESLVKNSMMVYVAYELKAQEASQYLADTTLDFPFLKKEADLRKVNLPDLCKQIIGKAKVYKDAIKAAELLRLEFNITYPSLTTYEAKVELRDRLLREFREVTKGIL
jgi:hypothetical protein